MKTAVNVMRNLITRWLDSGRHAQQLMKRNAFKRLLCYEGLEDRRLLAVTSLSSGLLTIDFNLVSESVTVGNDGANIRLIGSTFTGAGSTFATAAVTCLQVTDSGNLGSQSLVFAGIATFTLADGFSSSGIETVKFDNAVTATGTSSLMVNAQQSITVSKPIASSGGNLSLLANNGLTLNNIVDSAGGSLVLRADANGDGIGSLILAPAVLNKWTEQQTLTASDGAAGDMLGFYVALSADGRTALAAAISDDVGVVN